MTGFPLYPTEPSASEHWRSPAFAAELRAWVEAQVGPVELDVDKLRGWSTVWRAQASDGLFWAKQNCRLNQAEAPLLAMLAELVPERVVPVTAVDADRGFLLLPDQGDVLGEDGDVDSWCRVVATWAALQRDLIEHEPRLRATGVPVVSVDDCLPMLLERSEAMHALPDGDPRRLGDDEKAQVDAGHDVVRRAAEAVGGLGLPLALNHNDLHGGNVFDRGGPDGLRFFDLGDAMLTTPAAVLATPLSGVRQAWDCSPGDPRLLRVADAWIEVWSDLATARELRATLPDALRLAAVSRHDSWLRGLSAASADELADWGIAPAYWLARAVGSTVLDP